MLLNEHVHRKRCNSRKSGKSTHLPGKKYDCQILRGYFKQEIKRMDIKTEQSKIPHHPGCLTEPFRLISASSQGHQHDGIDNNTRPHPATPNSANYFPGLILQFPRQFQQPRHGGYCQKQELLRGRHTYCFRGAELQVKTHVSSCTRRRHQLCCHLPGASILWIFWL